ncbi:helix-turn-helix transcriptional regulator [Streptomyces sp. NPDC017979]|uniref:helix-turn-helix transcriptional regulator n=1 Tax=Streptomyces sp. NPDC017979 TaxID=3365024 RepID=UPI00379C5F3C
MTGSESASKGYVGPTARMIAEMTRKLRLKKGWSQEQLGKAMGYTAQAVSALETYTHAVSDQMLQKLEKHLGEGMGFFEAARVPVRLEKLPAQFKNWSLEEQKVLSLFLYTATVVHGLFQTEEYAKALIGGGYPPLSEQQVNELVEIRMGRKALFDRKPLPHIELILEEAALRRTIGSAEIMRRQLLFLLEEAERDNVTIQVLPLDCGLSGKHAGVRGGMTLAETPDHDRVVYMEIQDESVLVSDQGKVSTYAQRYAKIRSQALDPRASLGLIKQLAGENP